MLMEAPFVFQILFDQAQRSVKQQLHNFVKEDVRKFKETKKHFDRMREDMEIAQVKNAQAPRNKPHEVEEATGTLSITRKCFRHLALDYVLQINVLQAKKKFEILDAMLSFMHAQYSLFQQGYNLLDEIDPYMKKLAAEVSITTTHTILMLAPKPWVLIGIGLVLIENIDPGRVASPMDALSTAVLSVYIIVH
ncbi:unnamed protein product [Coregonus sp. 'balchen']|nr:unnamed protein product [Coregonus sp. 'balchen']